MLKKEYKTKYGVTSDLWKITSINIRRDLRIAVIVVGLYADLECNPIHTMDILIDQSNYDNFYFNINNAPIMEAVYKYLKDEIEFFIDSEDYMLEVEETKDIEEEV